MKGSMKIIKTGSGELYIKKRGKLYLVNGIQLIEVHQPKGKP